jgi:hypothetical protein
LNEAAAAAFGNVLTKEEYLSSAEKDVFGSSVEEMKTDMRNNKVDLNNLAIDDLGIYASPDAALKLSTLHNAKCWRIEGGGQRAHRLLHTYTEACARVLHLPL